MVIIKYLDAEVIHILFVTVVEAMVESTKLIAKQEFTRHITISLAVVVGSQKHCYFFMLAQFMSMAIQPMSPL